MLALATRRPRRRLIAKATAKRDGKAAAKRADEAELPHLVRRDLRHRNEHQRRQRQIDREAIEVVGRHAIEHAEIAADESGQDQREDRQCGVEDGLHKANPGRSWSDRTTMFSSRTLLQFAMQHLAGRVARHLAFGDEACRSAAACNRPGAPSTMPAGRLSCQRGAVMQHDHGVNALAPLFVRQADHRDVLHQRMRADQGLRPRTDRCSRRRK